MKPHRNFFEKVFKVRTKLVIQNLFLEMLILKVKFWQVYDWLYHLGLGSYMPVLYQKLLKYLETFCLEKLHLFIFSVLKNRCRFFPTLIGTSPAVILSEGKFFTTFLTVAPDTHLKDNFLFIRNFCVILRMLG